MHGLLATVAASVSFVSAQSYIYIYIKENKTLLFLVGKELYFTTKPPLQVSHYEL